MINRFSPSQVFKYCPKCGKEEFSSDTEKSMKCTSCGFSYFINMAAAVVAIIRNETNEILFTIRKYDPAIGMLDLPGGFVDLGETAEKAIVREIGEELNLKIIKMEFVGTFTNKYIYGEIEYQTLYLVFICSVENFQNIHAQDDVTGFVFRNPNSVKVEEIGFDSIRKIVESLKS